MDLLNERLATVALALSALGLLLVIMTRTVGWIPELSNDGTQILSWVPPPGALMQSPVRDFSVITLNGDTVSRPSPGKVTVIVAYKTTCRYCEASQEYWEQCSRRLVRPK